MIIQLTDRFSLGPVLERLDQLGLHAQVVQWQGEPLVVAPGGELYTGVVGRVRGVAAVYPMTGPIELASASWRAERSVVRVGGAAIGGERPVIIAGARRIGDGEHFLHTARLLAAAGAGVLRGGTFGPPASPYASENPVTDSLRLIAAVQAETGLPVLAAVTEPGLAGEVAQVAEMLEVGPENMQNVPLLRALGRAGKPVLLNRAPWAPITLWLLAAEYLLAEGNQQVVLCERGADSPDPLAGRAPDLAAVPRLRRLTHLPVLVAPGCGTADLELTRPVARAALAVGADGVLLEAGDGTAALKGLIEELVSRKDGSESQRSGGSPALSAGLRRSGRDTPGRG